MRTPLRLFLCLFLTGIHLSLYSQAEDRLPGDKVNIKGTYTLKKIFDLIYRQTNQQVTYANTLLNDQERVTVDVSGTIDEALTVVLAGKAITWVYSEGYVALRGKGAGGRPVSSVIDPPVITVSGTVTDEEGNPLPGATVKVKGSNKGAQASHDGTFVLPNVDKNAILIISSIGFENEEIAVRGKNQLDIPLKASVNALREVVVAYGTTTQHAYTGAVTMIKGEQIQALPNRSFDKSLQGLVPGLQITNGTGQPGGGVSNMVLRGISTGTDAAFGSTVRNPLIVIDGVPVSQDQFQISIGQFASPISNPLAQLNPSDIESISVLKDASAIALYGSKAGNGVILVVTKSGKAGKTVVGVRHQTDISYLPQRQDVLNQEEYKSMLYATYKTTDPALWTDQAIRKDLFNKFPYLASGTDTSFYPAPDWIVELYNRKAITLSNEVSFSGGNEKTNYYLGLEYTKQDGIVRSTGYDRKSVRFNLENKLSKWLKIGVRNTFSYNEQKYANPLENEMGYGLAPMMSPLNPVRKEDGNYIMNYTWGSLSANTSQYNPAAVAEYNISKNNAYRNLGSLYGEISFLEYFSLSSNLGVDFMLAEMKEKVDPRFRQSSTTMGGSIIDRTKRRTNLISTNILRFGKSFGKDHNVNWLAGHEAQVLTEKMLGGEVRGDNTTLPIYDQLSSPGYNMSSTAGTYSKQTLLSYFSQLNYGYRQKYFLSASIRRDGSSRFGSRQQWGTYWSVGSGWAVTEESFMKGIPVVNYLKLRGSIGAAGSSGAVGPSTRFDILNQTFFNGETAIYTGPTPGNPNIRWEKTFSWDLGLETKLFNNRAAITADIYQKNTTDLIYSINLSSITGYNSVMDNIGNISNRGIELSVSLDVIKRQNLLWKLTATWSTNQNILKKANVPLFAVSGGMLGNEEGRNFNSYYLREWAGVNSDDGKPQWLDSTGKVTSSYSKAPRFFVGKPQPDAFGQFSSYFMYNGFDLSIQFYYQYGSMIYSENLSFLNNDGAFPYINQSRRALDFWQKPGDKTPNPRRLLNNSDRGRSASTRFLLDGDYIRLSNVSLGYNLPKHLLQQIRLQQLKIYVQGNNLAIWKKYDGPDPDNMNAGGSISSPFPISRSFSAGIQLNL